MKDICNAETSNNIKKTCLNWSSMEHMWCSCLHSIFTCHSSTKPKWVMSVKAIILFNYFTL